jgi:pilus assembly protein Flp/PilA
MEHKHQEDGASAVEYGLLVAGVAALIVLIVFAFGGVVKGSLFKTSCQTVAANAASSAASCNN